MGTKQKPNITKLQKEVAKAYLLGYQAGIDFVKKELKRKDY